jgi:Na+-driven multidrug efflux pump
MRDLTKGNIYKTFLIFAIPMVLSGILSQCYNVVNTIIAGKLLGEGALSAIGAITPIDTFVNSVFWGYGVGVGV